MKVIGNLTKDAIIRAAVSEGLTIAQSVGSGVVYETANASSTSIVYDTANDKIVVGYRDGGDSNYGKAVVGTVSGDSISFGSPVTFYNTSAINALQTVFDTNSGKIVFAFEGNSGYGIAIVGTVSGTSISFGSTTDFLTAQVGHIGLAYDSTNSKVVVCCRNGGNSNRGNARVGTVSGTSISFGTDVTYNSGGNTTENEIVYDTNAQKMVIAFRDIANSSYGTAIVGTVSGTDISFGSEVVFNSANSNSMGISYDPIAQKVLIAYMDEGNNYYGTAIVGTVSGTSISFGSSAVYAENNTGVSQIAYDANAQRHVIVYRNQTTSPYSGFLIPATVSGTSVSFGTATSFTSTSFAEPDVAYDADQKKVVLAYSDANNSHYGTARVFTTGYTQATGGTIADGKAVIVNSNGTVSTVSQSTQTQAAGTSASYESDTSGSSKTAAIVHDPTNNKILVVYGDAANNDYGTAVVGTVSGTSISFGTPVVFESAYARFGSNQHQCATFIDDKIVIVYGNGGNSNLGTAIHGTISGTSITFSGSTPIFNSGNTYEGAVVCTDTVNNKVIVAYRDEGNSNYGAAIVGTINGASVDFGSEHTFREAAVQSLSIAFDESAGAAVVAYRDSSAGKAQVLTVSGTSVSSGSAVSFNSSASTTNNNVVYDSNAQKTVITYVDGGNSSHGTAIVGTVSGTSISFGSEVVYNAATTAHAASAFDSNINRIVVAYSDGGSAGNFTTGIVSGNSITFGQTETQFAAFNVFNTVLCFDSTNKKCIVAYMKGSSSYDNLSAVLTPEGNISTLTTENFVGFMRGAALDGTNGEILSSCSIARNQSSLTPGQTYFVTPAGALSTTAGSPSVTAGTAISNTELIVNG